AQDPDVVRLVEEAHQVGDEPARRWAAGRSVFDGHDDEEPTAWTSDAASCLEAAKRRFDGDGTSAGEANQFLAVEGVAPCGLQAVHPCRRASLRCRSVEWHFGRRN